MEMERFDPREWQRVPAQSANLSQAPAIRSVAARLKSRLRRMIRNKQSSVTQQSGRPGSPSLARRGSYIYPLLQTKPQRDRESGQVFATIAVRQIGGYLVRYPRPALFKD